MVDAWATVPRTRPVLVGLAWALAGAALLIGGPPVIAQRLRDDLPLEAATQPLILVMPVVGAFVATRRPKNPIGWIFAVAGLGQATAMAVNPAIEQGDAASWMAWVDQVSTVLVGPLLLGVTLLIFPDGKPASPRWRFLVRVAWVGVGLGLLGAGFGRWGGARPGYDNPLEAGRLGAVFEVGSLLSLAVMVVGAIGGVVALVIRRRTGDAVLRAQVKWVMLSFGVGLAVVASALVVQAMAGPLPAGVESILPAPFIIGVPLAVAVAVLRHRLFAVDVILNRTIVFALLSAGLIGAYLAVVTVLGQAASERATGLPPFVAGVVMAVLFQPLRGALQSSVNRMMFGARDDPYEVVTRVGRSLLPSGAQSMLDSVVGTVASALRLPFVTVELADGTRASVGDQTGHATVSFGLTHGGEALGELVVATRSPGETFSPAEDRLLTELAQQTALAVQASQLASDLQQSRQRIVRAREEERDRLRRDLHDGLGPRLTGVTFALEAARNRVRDGQSADELLAGANREVQAAIADVRRVINDLRPPALDDLGLKGALDEHAARMSERSALNVVVGATGPLDDLPASVEVAALYIALEAITNVSRHSGATRCRVQLRRAEGLFVDVTDDGHWVEPVSNAGVGLSSMRERAEELGGTFAVECSPTTGTAIHVVLPLAQARAT